jgi:hypothetical protein
MSLQHVDSDYEITLSTGGVWMNLHQVMTRLALFGLGIKHKKERIKVFIIPSSTVNITGVNYVFNILNVSQNVFSFFVTNQLKIKRNFGIKHSRIEFQNVIERTAKIELQNYITQFDFYPQIEEFMIKNYEDYISNENLVILVGREKFVWDEASDNYPITGDFNEDGYTILYNNDESNDPERISLHNNIAVISITKLTALPDIDFEMARSGQNIFINSKTYVVSNTIHFLAERVFGKSIASEHVNICILRLDWTGGLYQSLASRRLCQDCKDKIYRASVAFRATKSFSCDELIESIEAMMESFDRIEWWKKRGENFKLLSISLFSIFGLSILTNIVSGYTKETVFMAYIKTYTPPLLVSGISIGIGLILLFMSMVCIRLSPGRKIEI